MRIYAAVIAVFMLASLTRAFADTSDADFFKHTWDNTNTELQLAKIATTRATHPDVKTFANDMWNSHNKLFNELKQLGDTKHWDFGTLTDNKELYDRYNGLSGAEFDRSFMNWVIEGHTRSATEFDKVAREGKDSDLKALAAKYLPNLQNHLKMAQDIKGRLAKSTMDQRTEIPANVKFEEYQPENLENMDLPPPSSEMDQPSTPSHGEYGEGVIQPAPKAQNNLPPPQPKIDVRPAPQVVQPVTPPRREFREEPSSTSYTTTYSGDCGCEEVVKCDPCDKCEKCETKCGGCELPCCATFEEFHYDNDYRSGTTHYIH